MVTDHYTTEKEYKKFTEYVFKWAAKLVPGYEVRLSFTTEDEDARADVEIDELAKTVYVGFGRKWSNKPTNAELERTAFHEICHILLAELVTFTNKFYNEEFTDAIEHRIIITLETLTFGQNKRINNT